MANPAKRKGDAAELEAARLLADLTGFEITRKLGAGRKDDSGDIYALPDCTIQVKHYCDPQRAVRETLAELPGQQTNAGTTFGAGMIRRPGNRWFFVLTPEQFATLYREATQFIPEISLRQADYIRQLENELKAWREGAAAGIEATG